MANTKSTDDESWFWQRLGWLARHDEVLHSTSPRAQAFIQAVNAQNMAEAVEEASHLLLQPSLQELIISIFKPGKFPQDVR